MAQYQLDFQADTLDAYPSTLTRRWNTSGPSPVVSTITEVLGFTKALTNTLGSSSRQLDAWNAVDADADRATIKFRSLINTTNGTGETNPIWACAVRCSGASGAENGYYFALAREGSVRKLGIHKYVGGTGTTSYQSAGADQWAISTWYVVEGEVTGTNPVVLTMRLYALGDLDTPISTHTLEDSSAGRIEGAGWVGVGRFGGSATTQIAYVALATGSSELPAAPWEEPVSFSGTVAAQSWPQSASITPLSLASYFSGDLTPFSYAVTTGALPAGLSLNSSTGSISGTPTTAASAVSIVVTATDAKSNTAATNAFNITITAVDTEEPTLSSPTGTQTGATTASGGVTTNEANGTLYAVVTTSATPPIAADIRAGTGAVYATSQAVSATGVQSVSATGLTAETTYYWHFLHDDAASNVSNIVTSASFTTAEAGSDLILVTALDAGNLNPTTSEITDAASTTPTVTIVPRVQSVGSFTRWTTFYFRLDNAIGKRPVFVVNTSQAWTGPSGESLHYTYTNPEDQATTWTRSGVAWSTVSGDVHSAQLPDAFTESTVWISWIPPYPVARVASLIEWIETTHPDKIHSLPSSANSPDRIGAMVNAQTNEVGLPVPTLPLYSYGIWDSTAYPSDGLPKRTAFIHDGTHSGEHPGSWAFEGFIRWLLSSDSRAVALRRHYQFFVYPMITPSGRYGGNQRGQWDAVAANSKDPNRDWLTGGAEMDSTQKLVTMFNLDFAGKSAAIAIAFHSSSLGSGEDAFYYSNPDQDATALSAWHTSISAEGSYTARTSDITTTLEYYARAALGADQSYTCEAVHGRSNVPGWMVAGEDFAKAMANMLASYPEQQGFTGRYLALNFTGDAVAAGLADVSVFAQGPGLAAAPIRAEQGLGIDSSGHWRMDANSFAGSSVVVAISDVNYTGYQEERSFLGRVTIETAP